MRLLRNFIVVVVILCSAVSLNAQDSEYKWLHPTPQGNTLRWVKMWDANNWYAVGDAATFMKTTNGGASWVVKSNIISVPGDYPSNFYGAEFLDMNTGFICTQYGKIIKTTDAGNTWDTSGYVLQPGNVWRKVRFLNSNTGFASGSTLAFTTDGGNSWSQYPNSLGNLGDVYARDMNNVVVVSGNNSNYSFTTNGGTSWFTASMGGPGNCETMEFLNDTMGFVCGSSGRIRMTTDGGHSWTNIANDTIGFGSLLDIDIVNTGSGTMVYLTGQDTALFRAPVGTSNWERVSFLEESLYDGETFYATDFSQSGDTFITVGNFGVINARYSSSNKKTFTNLLKAGNINKVWAESSTGRVITAGNFTSNNSNDNIMYSTNGGSNWELSNYPPGGPQQIYDIEMINNMTGYTMGIYQELNKVMKTTDGGVNWTLKSLPPAALNSGGKVVFNTMDFPDENTGYLFGEGGIKTVNGGDNWSELTSVPITIRASKFINLSTGWIGGSDSPYLLKTTDGGVSFIPENIDSVSVKDIFFLDVNTGWAACSGGKIRKTTNGGTAWFSTDIPFVEDIYSIYFTDQWNGMAVGQYGGVYRSRDGGASWESDRLPVYEAYDVFMTATNRAFIVGNTGAVLKYEETVTGTELTFINEVPEGYFLEQNYPNPFNPTTTIKFGLPVQSMVSLIVYDITGREISQLIDNEEFNAGIVSKSFTSNGLASGIYFYSLTINNKLISTKKMVLVK